MASRKGLGRGLSALIPPAPVPVTRVERAASEPEDASSAPLFIAITRIAPNPGQPRKVFRESELATLAASIREQGVLQPLVRRRGDDGYELIIGERRWRAAQLAGLDEVPAVVLDATDRQVVEMALVENVQRADLNPMELAEAFRVLIDDEGMTQDEAGARAGASSCTTSARASWNGTPIACWERAREAGSADLPRQRHLVRGQDLLHRRGAHRRSLPRHGQRRRNPRGRRDWNHRREAR